MSLFHGRALFLIAPLIGQAGLILYIYTHINMYTHTETHIELLYMYKAVVWVRARHLPKNSS